MALRRTEFSEVHYWWLTIQSLLYIHRSTHSGLSKSSDRVLYIKTDKISIIECKDLFSELEILELSINSTPLKQDFKIITTDAGTLGYGGFGVKVIIKF